MYPKQDDYHVVIPNYYDLEDFKEPNLNRESRLKDPYFLFVGRICAAK